MNRGNIRILIKQGTATDPKQKFYPMWLIEVSGPGGVTTDVCPPYSELERLLLDILTHELIVDKTRQRKLDFVKYRQWLHGILRKDLIAKAQTRLEVFNDPHPIYTEFQGYDKKVPFSEVLEHLSNNKYKK